MSELKPCPFCGKYAERRHRLTVFDEEAHKWCRCGNYACALSRGWIEVFIWNTRPIEDALRAEIARMQAVVDKCVELSTTTCGQNEWNDKLVEMLKLTAKYQELITT